MDQDRGRDRARQAVVRAVFCAADRRRWTVPEGVDGCLWAAVIAAAKQRGIRGENVTALANDVVAEVVDLVNRKLDAAAASCRRGPSGRESL